MVGSSWVANDRVARQGREGELQTARVLDRLADRRAVVMHNLRIPIAGISANIDHVGTRPPEKAMLARASRRRRAPSAHRRSPAARSYPR